MKGLIKAANTFKAGYHAKQNLNLFPTREELQAESKLLQEKAHERERGTIDAKTPQLHQSSKIRADILGNDPISKPILGIENNSVKRLKFTDSSSTSQTSPLLPRPTSQKSPQAKNPQHPSATATPRDKNKTVFLPTSQSCLDNLQDIVDEVVTTNHFTVWTKLCHALEIKAELGDSAYRKCLQAVLSKSSSAVRVSMQSSEPERWIYDNALSWHRRRYQLQFFRPPVPTLAPKRKQALLPPPLADNYERERGEDGRYNKELGSRGFAPSLEDYGQIANFHFHPSTDEQSTTPSSFIHLRPISPKPVTLIRLRVDDKLWADSALLEGRLDKEKDAAQDKALIKGAKGFKAGFIAKEAILKEEVDTGT
ncbi:hypothetical protein E6O75_ATG01083 [Venturia nashicola]|uniref:Uncharacterized protein n=1 Tax=Venturia nashicola TaxID=86259 RepID=A0A4Z1PCR6_9PEZI|nr:hypothetical protein E6O75_ATG01083 [Venturia nashicola]